MKKTYQQLEWILAEAERVNTVLVNDYTSLKERVKNLNSDVEIYKKKSTDLEISEKELKDDIDRLNLIIEYEREQRFDLEQKNEMQVVQMNKQKIELMNTEDRVTQLQETIRQQSESNKAKDEVVTQLKGKVNGLEESMKGLKTNFDDTFKLYNDSKAILDRVESERDDYLQKFTTTKQELVHATETIAEMENRISEEVKLMEMEQTHRCNLETQMDELQKHNRRLVQQMADMTAKDKAQEKTIDDLKKQIEQLERVRDHFTLLLDKEKSSKGTLEQTLAEEEKRRASIEAQSKQMKESNDAEVGKLKDALDKLKENEQTIKNLTADLETARNGLTEKGSLESQLSSLQQKYSQLESEKTDMVSEINDVVQKLSEELDVVKAQLAEERNSKQDTGSRHHEKERELTNKLKATEELVLKEREKVIQAEEALLELRKKHREDLETIHLRSSADHIRVHPHENGNGGTEDSESNGPTESSDDNVVNGIVEQKLKQHLEEEKQELEKLEQLLSEERSRHKEELIAFADQKKKFEEESLQLEAAKRELEEQESAITARREELKELEKQVQELAEQKEALAAAQLKLQADTDATNHLRIQVNEEKSTLAALKQEIESEKAALQQAIHKNDEDRKLIETELHHIETEKTTLAGEKSDIDNELQRLVEQKLEMQQSKQAFEDKETQFLITIKDKDAKIEELTHSLAEERKKEKLSSGQRTPDSKESTSFSSYFLSKKTSKEHESASESPVPDNLTDEERKLKSYNDYQVLLTDINTALFQKREQVSDIEKNTNAGYFKKMGLGSLKSSVTKLEDLQGRAKKAFRALDGKTTFTTADEAAEHSIIKGFRNELT